MNFLFKYKRVNLFKKEFQSFKDNDTSPRFKMLWEECYPCLDDKTSITPFDSHYVYHPAWAARILREINPQKHIDISSTLHFCSIVSAFIPMEFYDYRPAKLSLSNLTSKSADVTDLFFDDNSIYSLSCMHTVEHIGLGRYGDPLDPNGDLKAFSELKRVTAQNGHLLIVTPVGVPRIQFNAHRVYSYEQIISYFDGFDLKDFSLVVDDGTFITNADPTLVARQKYGCGCFWFKKL